MRRFIIRRLLVTAPMVLVVVSLTWGLIRLAPGNFYTGEKPLPVAIERNLRRQRITLSELEAQARQQDIPSLERVAYAVLETNGKISFLTQTG